MTSRTPSRASGFTMVEMMIAVALGLIVLAALTTYFVQTSQNRSELDRNSRQIENGRYAVDTLRDDLMLSGFYADAWAPPASSGGNGTQWQLPAACTTDPASMGFDGKQFAPKLPVPIYGYPNGIAPPIVLGCLNDYKAGTDVLVVRRFNTDPTPAAAPDPKQVYLQQSECTNDDPSKPFYFGLPGTQPFNLRKVDCASVSDYWRYREYVYYVRNCSQCGTDTIPTLVRMELDGGAMVVDPIVEGVEDFRVEFGIDNDSDGAIEQWTRCTANACDAIVPPAYGPMWSNVVGARIYVLVKNLETSPNYVDTKTYSVGLAGTDGPFNDGYKRHVYVAQIQLANRQGPREPILGATP